MMFYLSSNMPKFHLAALDSLLNGGGASSLFNDNVKGLEDFELIAFIVIQ